jgi:hypothetical protein
MDRTLEDSIVNKIVTKADGMYVFLLLTLSLQCLIVNLCRFLLAKLHTESLVGKSSSREVRNVLGGLPVDVTASYDDAIGIWKRSGDKSNMTGSSPNEFYSG